MKHVLGFLTILLLILTLAMASFAASRVVTSNEIEARAESALATAYLLATAAVLFSWMVSR